MKERIIKQYEANDGTVFDSEEECQKYEFASRIKEIPSFDDNFNPVIYYCSEYVVIRAQEDVDIIEAYCTEQDILSPFTQGDYNQYNAKSISRDFRGVLCTGYNGEWIPLVDKINKLIKVNNIILKKAGMEKDTRTSPAVINLNGIDW